MPIPLWIFGIITTILLSCNGMKPSSSESASEEINYAEQGYIKGTVETSTTACSFVIRTEDNPSDLLDAINLEETFQKDGMKVWFTYTGLRQKNRCNNARPVTIDLIEKRK